MTQLAEFPNRAETLTPTLWAKESGSWTAFFTALAHVVVEAERANGTQTNVQAVSRLDHELLRLQGEGLITVFEIGGWRDDEISVKATMPDELYFQETRLGIHQRLDGVLRGLNAFVSLELDTDYGESA